MNHLTKLNEICIKRSMLKLTTLFKVVAVVELFYGAAGLLIPPSLVQPILGWNLSPDGQWVTKLLGAALLSQAAIAWLLRKSPPVPIAWAFAAYQLGATAVDALIWWQLGPAGVFANPIARVSVMTAIPTHAAIGLLLVVAASRAQEAAS
jgi:hypothetical protein